MWTVIGFTRSSLIFQLNSTLGHSWMGGGCLCLRVPFPDRAMAATGWPWVVHRGRWMCEVRCSPRKQGTAAAILQEVLLGHTPRQSSLTSAWPPTSCSGISSSGLWMNAEGPILTGDRGGGHGSVKSTSHAVGICLQFSNFYQPCLFESLLWW